MPEQEKKGPDKWGTAIEIAKGAAVILAAIFGYRASKKNSGK